MERIDPYICTLEDAFHQIETCGRPAAFYYNDSLESFGLEGGSLKHPTVISLIHNVAASRNFGRYRQYDCWRLVIKDGGYRTLYRLDEDEFKAIKLQLLDFCRRHCLSIRASSRIDTPETVQCRAAEFFDGCANGIEIRVQAPRAIGMRSSESSA